MGYATGDSDSTSERIIEVRRIAVEGSVHCARGARGEAWITDEERRYLYETNVTRVFNLKV